MSSSQNDAALHWAWQDSIRTGFTEYQDAVQQTIVYPDPGRNPFYPLLGLVGEIGEFVDKVDPEKHFVTNSVAQVEFIKRVLRVISRTGNLLQGLKKDMRDGPGAESRLLRTQLVALTSEFKEALSKEIGDKLWYLAALCAEWNLDFAECAVGNVVKLASRAERGKLHGDGDNR